MDGAGAGGGWPRGRESRPLNPTLAKSDPQACTVPSKGSVCVDDSEGVEGAVHDLLGAQQVQDHRDAEPGDQDAQGQVGRLPHHAAWARREGQKVSFCPLGRGPNHREETRLSHAPSVGPPDPGLYLAPLGSEAEGGAAGPRLGVCPQLPSPPAKDFLRLMWKLSHDNCPYGVGLAVAQ